MDTFLWGGVWFEHWLLLHGRRNIIWLLDGGSSNLPLFFAVLPLGLLPGLLHRRWRLLCVDVLLDAFALLDMDVVMTSLLCHSKYALIWLALANLICLH